MCGYHDDKDNEPFRRVVVCHQPTVDRPRERHVEASTDEVELVMCPRCGTLRVAGWIVANDVWPTNPRRG